MGTPEPAVFPGAPLLARIVTTFEQVVMVVLIVLLMIVTMVCTGELFLVLYRELQDGALPLDIDETFEIFGFFLLVIIGLELTTTLKSYLLQRVLYVQVVIEVALIAVAQKLIIMDVGRAGGPTLVGIAALFAALVGAFWVVRGARPPSGPASEDHAPSPPR